MQIRPEAALCCIQPPCPSRVNVEIVVMSDPTISSPTLVSWSRDAALRLVIARWKEAILKMAKSEKVLEYKNMKLKIFPDLTTEISRRSALFNNVRGKLYRAGIQSGLIHPATPNFQWREKDLPESY